MQKLSTGIDLARRKGIAAALKAGAWRLKTAAFKKRIALEDRYGWYTYADWIRRFETPTAEPGEKDGNQALASAPRFSIVLLRGTGNSSQIGRTLDSLKAQTNVSWEALGALKTGGENPEHHPVLTLLEEAKGEFIQILEVGDTLHPDALTIVSHTFDHSPGLEIIYSDEDWLSEDGERQAPFFKPAWSPELLLSQNYFSRAFFKRTLLLQAAESHEGAALNWDDLFWICAEKARRIEHIPQVLVHKGSYKNGSEEASAHARQVIAHLQRRGIPEPTVENSPQGAIRLQWPVSGDKVSIIIPTRDRLEYLRRCVDSIRKWTNYPDYELILVDSGSVEAETRDFYTANPDLRVVPYEGSFNFSAALDRGAQEARGDLLLFLNNDTEAIESGWLTELVRWAEQPDIGVVGAQLLFPDGSIQHAGIVVGLEGHASHVFGGARPRATGPFGSVDWYRNYTAVTGACMAMRKSVFAEIGGFDEGYELVFSDIEICLRVIRAGYRVMYTPFAQLLHHEGKTRSRYMPAEDIIRGYADFKDLVEAGDPYFSPNLSTAVRIPTFRRPGEEGAIDRLEEIVKQTT